MRDPRCYSLESWPRREGRGEKGREPIGVLQVLSFLGVQEWIPVVLLLREAACSMVLPAWDGAGWAFGRRWVQGTS